MEISPLMVADEPLVMLKAPPLAAELLPAVMLTTPPTPAAPDPTLTLKEPAAADVEAPVEMVTSPLAPANDVPVAKLNEPLWPEAPAFAVEIATMPLLDDALCPLVTLNAPPRLVLLVPALITTWPPAPAPPTPART